jgi:hypothetical protein
MVVSWPNKIADKGGVRWQFHHVIDVVPTILEAAGIPAPDSVDGIGQKPIEGVSMAYSFDKANADAPSPHKTQYFEMMGVQGLYNDGWMLSAVPVRAPWELLGKAVQDPATAYKFELYDVRHDWTQNNDVAAQNPQKIRELTDHMFGEFAKYQVLPLDASVATRLVAPRPGLAAGRKVFNLFGQSGHRYCGQFGAECPQHVLHDHVRDRRPSGRRGRQYRVGRRPVRRLWPLFAQGQAGLQLEPARPQAREMGGAGRSRAGQAHAGIRLQI